MEGQPVDYRLIFSSMPGNSGLLLPDSPKFTIVALTDEMAGFANVSKQDLIGTSIFDSYPANPETASVSADVRTSLDRCIATKSVCKLDAQRHDVMDSEGQFKEMYWTVVHTPILDEKGEVAFIIHTSENVTDTILSKIKDDRIRSLEPAHNLFRQSAVAIHIFTGDELIVELANQPTLLLWDRDESVIGKPLLEALPEMASQHYPEVIREVMRTGVSYQAYEAQVLLHRKGQDAIGYFNFILQPYYGEESDKPIGVIAMVNEVTNFYNNRLSLAEKERSLELAVEIGDLGTFSISLPGQHLSYSPRVMKWFDVTPDAGLEVLLSKIHPDDVEMVRENIVVLSSGHRSQGQDIVFRVINEISVTTHYLRSIAKLQTHNGIPFKLSGIIQDVTNMIRSREEINQSVQQLRSVIESAPFPIAVYTGKEMKIAMANQSIMNVWGKGNDVLGKSYFNILPELKGTGIYESLGKVLSTGEAHHAQNSRVDLVMNEKLQPFWFNYSFTPLFDAEGCVYGVMNTAADVTDLNLANQKVVESARNFRNMILLAPVAICVMRGEDYVFDIVNPMMAELFGKERSLVEGKPLFEAMPELQGEDLVPKLEGVLKQGKAFISEEQEFHLPRHGEISTVYIKYIYEPMLDATGNIDGIMAVATDVTQQVMARRQIESIVARRTKELAEANQLLENSNAELKQFAYIASHDLQEPLRKISMFSQRLQETIDSSNAEAVRNMDRINISVSRMSNLIRDILGYSQLSKEKIAYSKTDLNQVMLETLADFDLILEEKGGKLAYSSLPVIEAIPLQMSQLFNNLVSNSLKYSRPGIPPEITVSAALLSNEKTAAFNLPPKPDGYVEIIFKDNGIGFPLEYADKIFQIFQRLHGKMEYAGTGIGLAMCRKIAENHQGLIYANAVEGEGAIFRVVLPVKWGLRD